MNAKALKHGWHGVAMSALARTELTIGVAVSALLRAHITRDAQGAAAQPKVMSQAPQQRGGTGHGGLGGYGYGPGMMRGSGYGLRAMWNGYWHGPGVAYGYGSGRLMRGGWLLGAVLHITTEKSDAEGGGKAFGRVSAIHKKFLIQLRNQIQQALTPVQRKSLSEKYRWNWVPVGEESGCQTTAGPLRHG